MESWSLYQLVCPPAAVGLNVLPGPPTVRAALHGPDLLLLEVGVESGQGVLLQQQQNSPIYFTNQKYNAVRVDLLYVTM